MDRNLEQKITVNYFLISNLKVGVSSRIAIEISLSF